MRSLDSIKAANASHPKPEEAPQIQIPFSLMTQLVSALQTANASLADVLVYGLGTTQRQNITEIDLPAIGAAANKGMAALLAPPALRPWTRLVNPRPELKYGLEKTTAPETEVKGGELTAIRLDTSGLEKALGEKILAKVMEDNKEALKGIKVRAPLQAEATVYKDTAPEPEDTVVRARQSALDAQKRQESRDRIVDVVGDRDYDDNKVASTIFRCIDEPDDSMRVEVRRNGNVRFEITEGHVPGDALVEVLEVSSALARDLVAWIGRNRNATPAVSFRRTTGLFVQSTSAAGAARNFDFWIRGLTVRLDYFGLKRLERFLRWSMPQEVSK